MTAGPWKPQLHFVWDIILDELLGQDQTSKTSGNFQDFYRAIVDGKSSFGFFAHW